VSRSGEGGGGGGGVSGANSKERTGGGGGASSKSFVDGILVPLSLARMITVVLRRVVTFSVGDELPFDALLHLQASFESFLALEGRNLLSSVFTSDMVQQLVTMFCAMRIAARDLRISDQDSRLAIAPLCEMPLAEQPGAAAPVVADFRRASAATQTRVAFPTVRSLRSRVSTTQRPRASGPQLAQESSIPRGRAAAAGAGSSAQVIVTPPAQADASMTSSSSSSSSFNAALLSSAVPRGAVEVRKAVVVVAAAAAAAAAAVAAVSSSSVMAALCASV
jgi:hypothetical protein